MRILLLILVILVPAPASAVQRSFEYDANGRLISSNATDGQQIHYTLDANGSRILREIIGPATGVPDPGFDPALDLDGDGAIDHRDLALLRGSILSSVGSACRDSRHDLNGDGQIDRQDAFEWLERRPWLVPLSGDWVGAPLDPDTDLRLSPPDDAVDFYDLAALTQSWDDMDALRDLMALEGEESGLAELQDEALRRLERAWSIHELPPVGAACAAEGASETLEATSVLASGVTLGFQRVEDRTLPADQIRIELRALGTLPVTCIQFVLESELDPADVQELQAGATESSKNAFRRVEPLGDGWRITWAGLDHDTPRDGSSSLLASFVVPRQRRDVTFRAIDGLMLGERGEALEISDLRQSLSIEHGPARLTLARTYPNPFNPRVTVEFGVSSASQVSVDIYDVRGRLVRGLERGALPAGWYRRVWDGTDERGAAVSSGIYFVQVHDGKAAVSARVVLVR